jgi:hypothetical protein
VAISAWSTNEALNTTIEGVDIDEGMLPGDINNWMRKVIAALRTAWDASYGIGKNVTIQASGGALPVAPIEGHLLIEY